MFVEKEKMKELQSLCKGHSTDILRTVVLGVEESLEECEGEYYGDLSEAVLESIHEDQLDSELKQELNVFNVWESENLYDVIGCIHEGAIREKVPESSGLTQHSLLVDLVIYALKVSI